MSERLIAHRLLRIIALWVAGVLTVASVGQGIGLIFLRNSLSSRHVASGIWVKAAH